MAASGLSNELDSQYGSTGGKSWDEESFTKLPPQWQGTTPWLTHSDFPGENAGKAAVPPGNAGGAQGEKDEASVSSAGSRSHTTGSILLSAAEKGDLATVKNLLARQTAPDPDQKTKYQSRSALQLACGYGQLDVVEQLLQVGSEPIQFNLSGKTPLHEACQGGHWKVLELLLDYTQEVDVQDRDGQSAAHIAATNGEVKCLQILNDKGAMLVIEDKCGRQPSHLAAKRNHRNVIEFLYDAGVDIDSPDEHGKLPIHCAAQYGALDCLVCLVERDCDITIGDNSGNLPIHFAASRDHLECVRFLVNQGCSKEFTQGDGKAAVHVAAQHGSIQVLHWLLEKGTDGSMRDNLGNTPLHYAGEGGRANCFNCLLQHGSDLYAVNNKGDTPLDSAKKRGHPVLMERAVKNEVTCAQCMSLYQYWKWREDTKPPGVVLSVDQLKSQAYKSPLPKLEKKVVAARSKPPVKKGKKKDITLDNDFQRNLPKRDLAAKYFGEYLSNDLYKLKL